MNDNVKVQALHSRTAEFNLRQPSSREQMMNDNGMVPPVNYYG